MFVRSCHDNLAVPCFFFWRGDLEQFARVGQSWVGVGLFIFLLLIYGLGQNHKVGRATYILLDPPLLSCKFLYFFELVAYSCYIQKFNETSIVLFTWKILRTWFPKFTWKQFLLKNVQILKVPNYWRDTTMGLLVASVFLFYNCRGLGSSSLHCYLDKLFLNLASCLKRPEYVLLYVALFRNIKENKITTHLYLSPIMFGVRVKSSQACKHSIRIPFMLFLPLPAKWNLLKGSKILLDHLIWSFSLIIFRLCFTCLGIHNSVHLLSFGEAVEMLDSD